MATALGRGAAFGGAWIAAMCVAAVGVMDGAAPVGSWGAEVRGRGGGGVPGARMRAGGAAGSAGAKPSVAVVEAGRRRLNIPNMRNPSND